MLDATPFLKLYSRFRMASLAGQDPRRTQERELQSLLTRSAGTIFARDHGFSEIKTVADYQRHVPLRNYEQMWTEYWKPAFPELVNCTWPGRIPFFPVSSGTSSGATKYIPCTREMIDSNSKAGFDLFAYHLTNRTKSHLFGGKNFFLGGSTQLVRIADGVYSGDLSGIAVSNLPWWVRGRSFPSADLALLRDWEEKIDTLARRALREDIRSISGVPSWLLIFFNKYREIIPNWDGRIASIFPKLELLVHGGVNFSPYRNQFLTLLEGSHAEMREVYPASEGFIAVADRGYGEGLRLNLDHGMFYEFVPLEELGSPNPTRHWIGTVQPDINYAIVMTTCAGLWSYVIGDTVRFVDIKVPRVLVTGRTSYYLSAFGEHVIAEELEDAVSTAAADIKLNVSDYSVGPLFPEDTGDLGGHSYIVEFSPRVPNHAELAQFAKVLDARLCKRNEDYEAHRAKGYGLRSPEVIAVHEGFFADWMKSRGKLGGQNKVPRIINDRSLLKSLRDAVARDAH